MILNLNNEDFKEEIKEGKVLVDFYADWCGPCKMLAPILETIENEIKIIKVNVDNHQDLAREYGIMSIPCLVLLENSVEIKRNVGFLNEDDLKQFIK